VKTSDGDRRGFTGWNYETPANGLHVENLQTFSQGNNHDQTRQLYGFEIGYDAFRVTCRDAVKMAKTLTAIEKRLGKLNDVRGYVSSYGEYVARFAEVIGAETMIFHRGGRSFEPDDYFTHNLGNGRNKIDSLIRTWAEANQTAA
jgi:hypothetical protein